MVIPYRLALYKKAGVLPHSALSWSFSHRVVLRSNLDHPPTHSKAFSCNVVQCPHPNCFPNQEGMCGAPPSSVPFFPCGIPTLVLTSDQMFQIGLVSPNRIQTSVQFGCQSSSTCIYECGTPS